VKKTMTVVLGVLLATLAPAVAQGGSATLEEFTRSADFGDLTLHFVHLNNHTVEQLFDPPHKYSIRVQASMATMLYVQAQAQKDSVVSTDFVLSQDGQSTTGRMINISNFDDGVVPQGRRIDGIVKFDCKLDPAQPFTVANSDGLVEFRLSDKALQMLAPPSPPPTQ
jgi:hypothetical protein